MSDPVQLPGGLFADVREDGVQLLERGRDADFEQLDEPLSWDDIEALYVLTPTGRTR